MTTFDEREHAYENKYAHDREQDFKAIARRNKLLGLWAAQVLDIAEPERDAYARQVVLSDLEIPTDEDVVQKLLKDFKAAGALQGEKEIREELHRLHSVAREQIHSAG